MAMHNSPVSLGARGPVKWAISRATIINALALIESDVLALIFALALFPYSCWAVIWPRCVTSYPTGAVSHRLIDVCLSGVRARALVN